MKHYNFDEIIERSGTDCLKYDSLDVFYGKTGLKPFWVADMDFRTPDFIVSALKKRMEHEVFGYTSTSKSYFKTYKSGLTINMLGKLTRNG